MPILFKKIQKNFSQKNLLPLIIVHSKYLFKIKYKLGKINKY